MSINKQRLSCQQANQMDLVDYLSTLGYNPAKIKGQDYWYLSPFRQEDTPSFKVHRFKNVWFDHGSGKGGSLIDFGLQYFNCQIPELLTRLSDHFPFHQPTVSVPKTFSQPSENPITINSEHPINSLDLLLYIKSRRIDFSIATRYLRQIDFELHHKPFKALGFRNDLGGFELRNPAFKGSSSPKASTTFLSDAKELLVFEGFFDFMSHQMIHQNQNLEPTDFLILNSTAFFEKSRSFMENYPAIKLFLDHDPTGLKCTSQAISWGSKYTDQSSLYAGHKDLNEWLQSVGKAQVNSFRPRLK